jgi:hypothetical protein
VRKIAFLDRLRENTSSTQKTKNIPDYFIKLRWGQLGDNSCNALLGICSTLGIVGSLNLSLDFQSVITPLEKHKAQQADESLT